MDKKTFAMLLNGREYGKELTQDEEKIAKENNYVVVFGASDDLLEFRGAINDEIGAYEGTTVFIDVDEKIILPNKDDEWFCKKCFDRATKIKIVSKWCPKNLDTSWLITTDTSFESFDIMEDGNLYCRGIVFSMNRW